MRIVSIHLKNIKSHRETDLTFSAGINVLSGANGSGKSTIFQAIGYALFGVSAQDFASRADRFLTIGAKRGEVSVVFQPADGELYRVTRTVGPAAKWLLAKERSGIFEIEEHANIQETEQRIASLLGLGGGRPLSDQFKLVIGPFQNDFLGPFVIRQPQKRQDSFDEILGIDAWRKTFDGTKMLAAAIAGKIETLQAEVAGKLEQVAVLPAKEVELAELKETSTAKHRELEQRKCESEKVTALLASLDAQKERLESVQNALQGVEQSIGSGKEYVANQQLLVEQSKSAAAVVAAATAGKKGYDAAEARLKVFREQEKEKSLLEKKVAELEKEQSASRAAIEIENRELEELRTRVDADGSSLADDEKSLSEALAGLTEAQKEAGDALEKMKKSVTLFRELPIHRIENALPYLFVSLDRMAAIDEQCKDRGQLVERSAALKAEADLLSQRQSALEKVQAERSELSGRRLSLVEGCEKIGAGDCPFLHEPCKNVEAGGGVEILHARIEATDAEVVRLDAEVESLAALVTSAQSAAQELAAAGQVMLELEKAGREREALEKEFSRNLSDIAPAVLVAAAKEWLASAGLAAGARPELKKLDIAIAGSPQERRSRLLSLSDGWRGVVLELEQALAERVRVAEEPVQQAAMRSVELTARREALTAKKRELSAASEKTLQREKAILAHQTRLDSVLGEIAALREALATYAGLEDAVKGAGEDLERFQPERDRYIAHQKDAGELEKRIDTLSRYQKRLQEYIEQLAARREELQGLQAGYQAERHEQARKDRELLLAAMATLQAELNAIGDRVARLEGEIAALRGVAEEIDKKGAAVQRLQEQGALVKFLRNQVFKNVSSQLSERFREEISSRADRIYRCISESDEELYWGENYQVVLKDMVDGQIRERTDDQLSGGQMMSAVVALRLALLQTIGARIAFFDEPTSNLDAERRENLAKAFRAIDVGQEEVTEHWYDQLFLVSHDVSFTEITDQMIQLD